MLADRGRLTEALSWCDRWIAADKLNAAGYYVRAAILQEKGELEPARAALNNAIYLDQEFVMAHFTLGMLARGCGDGAAERRHFGNTRQLLSRHQPGDPLPESDGISAGQLADILAFLEGGAELP
jgi:chemotaxis protein methyltransferase CheR